MKSKNANVSSSLRFRRWSRAGYAVFCSLGCAVTIGSLAVFISDKSLQKAKGVAKSQVISLTSDSESVEKLPELSELEALLSQVKELSFFNNTTVSAVAYSQYPNNYFIH